jgi:hypothetical protein
MTASHGKLNLIAVFGSPLDAAIHKAPTVTAVGAFLFSATEFLL